MIEREDRLSMYMYVKEREDQLATVYTLYIVQV
jgi:hypothetical protein